MHEAKPGELIRKKPLSKLVGLSEWTIDRKVKKGEFPRPIWLGPITPAWKLAEVIEWQNDPARYGRPSRSDARQPPKRKKIERRRLVRT
jgi:predicted DNA-binding transcriptional regulator AlpA